MELRWHALLRLRGGIPGHESVLLSLLVRVRSHAEHRIGQSKNLGEAISKLGNSNIVLNLRDFARAYKRLIYLSVERVLELKIIVLERTGQGGDESELGGPLQEARLLCGALLAFFRLLSENEAKISCKQIIKVRLLAGRLDAR